jgi:hypothetical protein
MKHTDPRQNVGFHGFEAAHRFQVFVWVSCFCGLEATGSAVRKLLGSPNKHPISVTTTMILATSSDTALARNPTLLQLTKVM